MLLQVCCDLENGSRSMVVKLNLGLVVIIGANLEKEVRDVIMFIIDRLCNGRIFVTDRKMDGQNAFLVPHWSDGG